VSNGEYPDQPNEYPDEMPIEYPGETNPIEPNDPELPEPEPDPTPNPDYE
jgi:hypothetical protein